jgi:AcrR family transcriptional regulator
VELLGLAVVRKKGHRVTTSTGLRQRKSIAAKLAFFQAAVTLFREKGYDETSVDEIADRAGFSRATFFNHFGTKEGVLRYYGQMLAERVEQSLAEMDQDVSPLKRIECLLRVMLAEAEQSREELRVVYRYRSRDPDHLDGLTASRRKVWDLTSRLVAEAQQQGEVRRDLSARELAAHLLSIYQGAAVAVIVYGVPLGQAHRSSWRFILPAVRGFPDEDSAAQ